jgi:tRNA-modifying protein YgfZ
MELVHQQFGATLAQDGIPLHYGNLMAEYEAALNSAVLMDRSHEGRFVVTGKDRLNIFHRISTNDLAQLANGSGKPTILTNPNGRILDRLMVYNHSEQSFVTTEPGRGAAVQQYLLRNLFYNDDAHISDIGSGTRLFTIHGPLADHVIASLTTSQPSLATHDYLVFQTQIAGIDVTVMQRKQMVQGHWAMIVPTEHAELVWNAIQENPDIHLAGSLTYNAIRIRSGQPAAGRELTETYIPLEAGLWDEVSFQKGCYTGQEIIARMESRGRLAKIMVILLPESGVAAPASIYKDAKEIGTLTSCTTAPDGIHYGIGYVKLAHAEPDTSVLIGTDHIAAKISSYAGTPPPYLS